MNIKNILSNSLYLILNPIALAKLKRNLVEAEIEIKNLKKSELDGLLESEIDYWKFKISSIIKKNALNNLHYQECRWHRST